jgi:hypothetical protein
MKISEQKDEGLTSGGNNANTMLYAEIRRKSLLLFRLYSEGWELPFTWEDIMHDVLIRLDFDCTKIALFCYCFKKQLRQAKAAQYIYLKHTSQYYSYEKVPMSICFCDFPIGADYETCIRFLVNKIGRPITAMEAATLIRTEDYTKRFLKNTSGIEMIMRRLEPELVKMKRPNHSKSVSGLKNGRSKLTPEIQSEAKRLHQLWGKKYTAIGLEVGVSKDTVRDFILGRSYRAKAV